MSRKEMLPHEKNVMKKTVTKTVLVTAWSAAIDILSMCNMVVSTANIGDITRMDGDKNG